MDGHEEINQTDNAVDDFYLPDEKQIHKLWQIIRKDNGFKFTYKDAEEIGYQLIMLYECLARGQRIVAGGNSHGQRK